MVRCVARRSSPIQMATHRSSGRSWAKVRGFFRNTPTDTMSACTGPTVARWAITASNTGRSWAGGLLDLSFDALEGGAHAVAVGASPGPAEEGPVGPQPEGRLEGERL